MVNPVPDRGTDPKRRVTRSTKREEMDTWLGEWHSNEELDRKITKRFSGEQPNRYDG